MATILELYRVDYWKYRAEGNANIVLQYIGPHSRFRNTVLRLRKADRLNDSGTGWEGTNSGDDTITMKNLTKESYFATEVIGLLLGQDFVEQLIAVALPPGFLSSLALAMEPSRPESRRQKGIDLAQSVGFLALDHTRFIKPSPGQSDIAVEIKPKWGFLTKSAFLRKDQDIKRRKCRFCMYQHQKIKTGQEGTLSKYCPIDLFSGTELLVQDALDSLVDTPQNNLRLFVNGIQQPVSRESMAQCLSESSTSTSTQPDEQQQRRKSQWIESDNPLDHEKDASGPVRLTEVLTQILVESPLLRRLGRLQQALDSLDVETVHRLYTYLLEHDSAHLPEPTVEEFLETAQAFMDRTDMNAMMTEDQETFETHNAAGLGFEPEDDLEELPESLQLHFIREFLLSATLKDCSILVTIRRDTSSAAVATTASIISSRLEVDEGSPEFHEACHQIKVKEEMFVYKITCIDLDPKKMTSVPMYLKKDRTIVDHYLATVGDREATCGAN
ncbi:Inositol-pentakisphosphate 2-kinase [Linnemannia schmuckeri]|uniref:Inositol-pentakisphosphate 2-kinase n=1 Tax=Linnemannia schmuckeri TaxID=64567 RepID=A0A9P5S2L2_9FUNG|nr:Inositol-pentakisphosphate 2-kinase [Linnemannia schmuckeri]